jgi:hypothetical protein
MTHKLNTLKFVVPTGLADALVIMSIGAIYFTMKYVVLVDQAEPNYSVGSRASAELPNPDLRLSRIHLLLSSMK